jgi:hypothetical protein
MSGLKALGQLWCGIQRWLFPALREELGELSEKHREFITVCEMCTPQEHLAAYRWVGVGCPPKDRLALCKAFIAKAVWDLPTTRSLLDRVRNDPTLRRLCGWETTGQVPSESTFSRAFAAFAAGQLPQTIHAAMFKTRYGDKLAGHLSRDATAVKARERAGRKPDAAALPDEQPPSEPPAAPTGTRLERQRTRTLAENVAELPQACDWGTKKNSQGKRQTWRGYKLHVDTIDGDIPVSWLLTAASLHDSQAAIPLAQMSAARVTNLYDLADAAYDAAAIREMSAQLGHVALIDHNPRRGEKREFSPAEARRYGERSSAERVNAHLHDSHGGRHVRVRGAVKVAAHLSFGLLVIAAEQLLRLLA